MTSNTSFKKNFKPAIASLTKKTSSKHSVIYSNHISN